MLGNGETSSVQLVEHYLTRIKRHNPQLNAVIAINPDALKIAKKLDQERKNGNIRSPLHGMPVLLKDNIEALDPMPTTAGSLALKDNIVNRDASMVARLRKSGAIILGKANLSEWANFRSERSSSGWSGVGGQTRNPYDLERNPCGSSSGSGAAVAADFATLAVGTETNGSIVCPSGANGIVGIKPSIGLVSRTGVVPLAHSQDTTGPMTRSVAGAAMMLNVMQGVDPSDRPTVGASQYTQRDYTLSLKKDGLKGKKIGVVRSAAGFHEGVDGLFNQAIADMKAQGAIIVDDLELSFEGNGQASYDVLLYEFKHDINQYLKDLPNALNSLTLEKLIVFNKKHATQVQQEIFDQSQAKGPLTDQEYQDALTKIHKATREDGIDKLLAEHQLDALIAPTGSPAWTIDRINGDRFLGGSSTFAAVSGYPNITVPMGYVEHLPVGISIFSRNFAEPTLIEIAYAYEQASQHRKPPEGLK